MKTKSPIPRRRFLQNATTMLGLVGVSILNVRSAERTSATNSTITVATEDELRRAIERSVRQNVNILIERVVTVTRTIDFPQSDSVVRLIGVTPEAGIRFHMTFDKNWNRPGPIGGNGLKCDCRQAIIRGLRLSGYETLGSVIKGHVAELLDISECHFVDNGTIQFPHKVNPPRTADDTLYNQCIGAHRLEIARVSIVNCRFERCALNNRRWSHCIYVSARSVLITGNEFVECGNPFAVGPAGATGSVNILSNRVLRPRPVMDARGAVLPTYLASLGPEGSYAFMFNKIEGQLHNVWTGQPRPENQLIDYNDYKGVTYSSSWAGDTTKGVAISWDEWRKMGFDRHSTVPQQRRN
ncbi:MAG: hypothetical protein FJ395_20300 [Verrucomicrobia bacterium]|nr:hypothetical protein [Verrucomicrobiota bacterium]